MYNVLYTYGASLCTYAHVHTIYTSLQVYTQLSLKENELATQSSLSDNPSVETNDTDCLESRFISLLSKAESRIPF